MKTLDKIGLVIFSIIVLVLSLIMSFLISGWLDLEVATEVLEKVITNEISAKITLGVSILFVVLALKCIFFNSYKREELKGKEGILLENENGKLLVSKDTIESLTNTVVKTFETAETVTTKVDVDEESKISIYVTLFVYPDAVIKDLTTKLQTNIKSAIKKSLDLDVKEVNIRVKNISVKKENIIKE